MVSVAPLVQAGTAPPEPDLSAADDDLRSASVAWFDAYEDPNRPTWPAMLEIVSGLLRLQSTRRALRAVSWTLRQEGALPGDRVEQVVHDAKSAA